MMPQLDFETFYGQIAWLVISFAITYFLAHFFLAPKLNKNISSREDIIKKNLEEAESNIIEAKKIRDNLALMLKKILEETQIEQNQVELSIKNISENNNIKAEKQYFETLQREDKKLDEEYNIQIDEHLPVVSKELSDEIIAKLLNLNSRFGNVS